MSERFTVLDDSLFSDWNVCRPRRYFFTARESLSHVFLAAIYSWVVAQMTNLPPSIAEHIECLCEGDPVFMNGAEALFNHLLELAPEFDDDAAHDYYSALPDFDEEDPVDNRMNAIALARWQHQQSSAQIAALKAELEDLKADHSALRVKLAQRDSELDHIANRLCAKS
jgi:hypothetical protein